MGRLHDACLSGDYPLVETQLATLGYSANDKQREGEHSGSTPLHIAVSVNTPRTHMKDVHSVHEGASGGTCLGQAHSRRYAHYASQLTCLIPTPPHPSTVCHQARQGHIAIAHLLVAHAANVNATDDMRRATPLHYAAAGGHVVMCRFLICEHLVEVDPRDVTMTTPLHMAASYGHTQTCELLADHGADLSAQDTLQQSPLKRALQAGQDETCRFLVMAMTPSENRAELHHEQRRQVR